MRALLCDALFRQHQNQICALNGGKPVRDGKRRPPLGQRGQRLLHDMLALVIQRRGRLIQNQDRRVFQENPGDGDALFLPARELDAPLADVGIVAVLQLRNEAVRARLLGRPNDILPAGAWAAIGDVVVDRAREEIDILLDDSDMIPQGMQLDFLNICAV